MPSVNPSLDKVEREASLRATMVGAKLGTQLCCLFELFLLFLLHTDEFNERTRSRYIGSTTTFIPLSAFSGLLMCYKVHPKALDTLESFRNEYVHNGERYARKYYDQLLNEYLLDLIRICYIVKVKLDFTCNL